MIATMPLHIAPTFSFENACREQLQTVTAKGPDWLNDLRLQAMSRFDALGLPTRRLEAWKYINLRSVLSHPLTFQNAAMPLSSVTLNSVRLPLANDAESLVQIVFHRGTFQPHLSDLSALPQGVKLISLAHLVDSPEEMNRLTGAERALIASSASVSVDDDAFSLLNTALFEDGLLISVPDSITVAPLIRILYVLSGETDSVMLNPRHLIALGQNAKASLSIETVSIAAVEPSAASIVNCAHYYALAAGATADISVVANMDAAVTQLTASRCELADGAKLSVTTVTLGGGIVRHSLESRLNGENASLTLNGLDVLRGNTEVYHHTLTAHDLPNATSEQYYKAILDDSVKSEFNGTVHVAPGANGTDSRQLNKTLLLSPEARVWTRPQLKILADDVKCAHGATVGQLDKNQLFYLASRGIDAELAQSLLTYGFAEEIINRIESPAVRRYLDARVLDNLRTSDAGLRQELGA